MGGYIGARRSGSQTRPDYLHPLAPVGEGLAPPAGLAPRRLIWGNFAAPAASSFLSDQKATKESPGVCSDGQVTSILIWMWPAHSRYTPGPPFTGELDSGAWCNCTGAGWPLTYRRSPARCHCAAKPESYRLYPLKRASTGRSPVVRRVSDGTISSLCRLFSVPRPRGVHPIGVPKREPNGNPAQAISIGRGRVAEGASLALSGETSDLELTRTRLVGAG